MIFSIAMGADYLFYVNFIAIRAPTFFGHIISVLASVEEPREFSDLVRARDEDQLMPQDHCLST